MSAGRSVTELRRAKAEALRGLVRTRMEAPERDRILAELDRIVAALEAPGTTLLAAQEKVQQAEADREEKRKPYEADPLFMYLWRRRYGTRDYDAGAFVRFFDRKVAHLIDFESARVNYTLLMELPDRLREHADRLGEERGGGEPDPLQALAAIERRPDIAALLSRAHGEGAEEFARRLAAIDDALKNTR